MYFDRPVYLWLLVLLPLLWFFLSRYVSTGDRVRKMWAKPSLSALLTPHRRDFLAALLVVVGFISLAVALAECSIQSGIGFTGDFPIDDRWDAVLFGERQSRIVVSLPDDLVNAFVPLASRFGVPVSILGYTDGDQFRLNGQVDVPISQISDVWNKGLEAASG